MGITAKVVVRADSAYFSRKVVDVCRKTGASFSLAVAVERKIREAITTIPEDAWTPIKYASSVWDAEELRWISDAEIAEVPLFEEIKAAGFRGGYSVVRDYLQPLRAGAKPADRARKAPSLRDVTGWITRHPDSLTQDETSQLKAILGRCPQLNATAEHVRTFAEMMNARAGHKLAAWIDDVKASNLPELVSFVNGIGCDLAAVEAGPTLPFSSGAVEGQVNRIKMLKRQMFGRAGLALLRKRVLLAA
jgi:hypothetical protein